LQIPLVHGQLEENPVHLRDGPEAAEKSAATHRGLLSSDGVDAAARHGDERSLRVVSSLRRLRAAAKRPLDASQQVVRLEDEQQLPRHRVEDRCDLRQVAGRRRLDDLSLSPQPTMNSVGK